MDLHSLSSLSTFTSYATRPEIRVYHLGDVEALVARR